MRALSSASRLLAVLLATGCAHTFNASISTQQPEGAGPFTAPQQERAKAIAVEIGRAAGFSETDLARRLEDNRMTTWPYHYFMTLGGEDFEQSTVIVFGEIREDRREIVIDISDDYRGEPLPVTEKLIEDLRAGLARAFPDASISVQRTRKLRTFAP
jgi:succinylglutamate desuccinylase